jgi:hypothetical protein
MKETIVSIRSTRKETTPQSFEMGTVAADQRKEYEKLDEGRDSVRKLIP